MEIRKATTEDIPVLVEMGAEFAAYAPYPVEYSKDAASTFLRALIDGGIGVVFVGCEEGVIVAYLAGAVYPLWYAANTCVAGEIAWWVDPDYRTGGMARELVRSFEGWAADKGAAFVSISDINVSGEFSVGSYFTRLGYKTTERTHIKEV